MNMSSIREKSKIFLWVCLIGFILSLVGVMGSGTGGGGGFEEPLERDPEDVLKDVKNRYVTIEKAKEDYKVSITANLEIDENATTKLRNN